jgi:hypothetical protein
VTLFLRNERDTDNSGLRKRVPALLDDDEEETTLESQIRPKYQIADTNEDDLNVLLSKYMTSCLII